MGTGMDGEQASKLAAARARWKGSTAYRQSCTHPRRTGGGGSHDGVTYVMSLRCPDCGRRWEEVVRYDGATRESVFVVDLLKGRKG